MALTCASWREGAPAEKTPAEKACQEDLLGISATATPFGNRMRVPVHRSQASLATNIEQSCWSTCERGD